MWKRLIHFVICIALRDVEARDMMFIDVRDNRYVENAQVSIMKFFEDIKTSLDCMVKCMLIPKCLSINFNKRSRICHILDIRLSEICLRDYAKPAAEWIYYGTEAPLTRETGVIYCSREEHMLQKSTVLTTFDRLKKTWRLSFELKLDNRTFGSVYDNIILVTNTDENIGKLGDRILAIFVNNENVLIFGGTAYKFIPLLPFNVYTKIVVQKVQKSNAWMLEIYDNQAKYEFETNTGPQEFENVKLFASDNFHVTAGGFIKNILLENLN